jgi:hypothetical protein
VCDPRFFSRPSSLYVAMFVEYLSDSKIRTGYSSTSVENTPPDLQGVLQPPSLTRHFTSSPNKTLPLKLIHTHVNEINDILIPNIESTRLDFATAYRMNAECTSPESRNGTVGAQCSGLVPRLESAHKWPSLLTQVPPPAMLEIMILQSETRGDPALDSLMNVESSQSLMEPRALRELEALICGFAVVGTQLTVASRATSTREMEESIVVLRCYLMVWSVVEVDGGLQG